MYAVNVTSPVQLPLVSGCRNSGGPGQGHQQAKSSLRSLPGGFGAGTFLGGLLFIIKFNGACLRPPIPRPLSRNKAMQLKYIDDSTQAASINLKKSLMEDPEIRPRPLKYHERHQTILKPEEDIMQQELDRFYTWTVQNKLPVNRKKCLTMQFSRSHKYDFPMQFTIGSRKMACPVWHSSLTLAQSRSLERCQRVAMAAMVGHWAPSLTDQLLDLGLERLDARRVQICKRFAHTTTTKSRHKDIFTVAVSNHPRPVKASRKFVEPITRTAGYRKSAVPFLTRLLNNQ